MLYLDQLVISIFEFFFNKRQIKGNLKRILVDFFQFFSIFFGANNYKLQKAYSLIAILRLIN